MTAKTRGFSIVELMIVIFITSVMLSLAAFSFNRYRDNTNLRTAARQLSADISNTKQQAISNMSSYNITFNQTSNTYTMNGSYTTIRSLDSFGSGVAFNALPLSGSTYTLTFQPRGTLALSSTTATIDTITLNNNRMSTANVIYNLTGKTYVTFNMR